MIQLTTEFKDRVFEGLLLQRNNFDGSDSAFAKQWGINNAVFSRLKNGERDGLLKDAQILNIGRELDININERKWVFVRTEVFEYIEEDVMFCKEYSKAKIMVDECGIGKTFSGKYLSRTLKNCFYVDASQAKTKQLFIRLLAKTVGVDSTDKYAKVKANLKYYLKSLPQPMVIIDEAGDLEYPAFLEIKELWNATEGACGWYMMGADGFRAKFEKGIASKKVGYTEIFSRFSDKITTVVPVDKQEKLGFYKNLITNVLAANCTKKTEVEKLVKKCLTIDDNGRIGGLRRAESLLILNS
jgi:hypothetical protein